MSSLKYFIILFFAIVFSFIMNGQKVVPTHINFLLICAILIFVIQIKDEK